MPWWCLGLAYGFLLSGLYAGLCALGAVLAPGSDWSLDERSGAMTMSTGSSASLVSALAAAALAAMVVGSVVGPIVGLAASGIAAALDAMGLRRWPRRAVAASSMVVLFGNGALVVASLTAGTSSASLSADLVLWVLGPFVLSVASLIVPMPPRSSRPPRGRPSGHS